MTVGESVLTSVMGFFIVFAMLAFLAIVILIFAKVAGAVSGKGSKQPAPVAAAPAGEDASEKIAIITSVICEELNGSEFAAVPFREDEDNRNSDMEIGYIVKSRSMLSDIAETYIDEVKKYLSAVKSANPEG